MSLQDEVSNILKKTWVEKDDAEKAIELIKKHMRGQKAGQFKSRGECINCHDLISYGFPCNTHQKYGDEWLVKLFSSWNRPQKITFDYRGKTIVNGRSASTYEPYTCDNCRQEIDATIEAAFIVRQNENEKQSRYQRKVEQEIISGERKSTPAKRFWLMRKYLQPGTAEGLRFSGAP